MEVASPSGRSWIWTRKQAPVRLRGTRAPRRARVGGGRRRGLRGRLRRLPRAPHRLALVGGHRALGRRARGGLEPGGRRARRARVERAHASGWTASPPRSPPLAFADDLSRVGDLEFTPWSAREDHTRRLLFRSDYLQPFGQLRGRAARRAAAGVGPRRDGVARRQVVRSARRSHLDRSRVVVQLPPRDADRAASPPPAGDDRVRDRARRRRRWRGRLGCRARAPAARRARGSRPRSTCRRAGARR